LGPMEKTAREAKEEQKGKKLQRKREADGGGQIRKRRHHFKAMGTARTTVVPGQQTNLNTMGVLTTQEKKRVGMNVGTKSPRQPSRCAEKKR